VNASWIYDDFQTTRKYIQKAKVWNALTIICGVPVFIIWVYVVIVVVMNSFQYHLF